MKVYLKIKKVKAIGLSFGGLTLLELAKLNPDRIQATILIGASHNYQGGKDKGTKDTFSFEKLPKSFVEQLKKIHYHGEAQIKAMFNPNLNYQISLKDEELHAFNFRTLIVNGDSDEILGVEPAFALHKKIPDSALWIVPNTGHLAITGSNKKNFLTTSLQFLTWGNTKTDANKK